MKRIILVFIVLTGIVTSCTKNFDEFNTDQKHATEVPGEFLFTNAQKELGDHVATSNVNLNIFKLWAQYWTETTYTDEANYDIVNRNIADAQFRVVYRDILADLREARRLVEAEQPATEDDEGIKQNKLHIIQLVEAYAFNFLLEIFGDIPYSEALDPSITQPKYDDARTIYLDLLSKVKASTDALNDTYGSFGASDLVFGGDVALWRKFGNSLQIKMAITIADVEDATARTYIEGAVTSGIFEQGEAGQMAYLTGSTNANPMHIDMVLSGRNDFVPANTIIDLMNDLEDPRRDDYFTTVEGTENYQGGVYGETSPFGQLSHVSDLIQSETFPVTFIDFTEIAFYLAEAAERGYNVGGTAEEWYNQAVTSSILSWNGTEEEATAYLAKPEVAYQTAAGDWKEKIGTQAWLAFYTRGLEGWTIWRRLDTPTFNVAPTISSEDEIPTRFTYPIIEQTLNAANWEAASAAIGGDLLTTPLFWDIN